MKKITLFSVISLMFILVSQTFVSNSYSAQTDYFLKLEGVDGEAIVNGEEGWIQLETVQYNETDLNFKAGSKNEVNVDFSDNPKLSLIKLVDKSSPVIIDVFASGTHREGTLLICNEGQCDLKIPLSDIAFLDYKMSSNQDTVMETITISFKSTQKDNALVIPSWIKNNAKWFADGVIGQSDFTKGIEFMINENIINIPELPESTTGVSESKVPDWIKNNAKWWADGQISDQDFVKGIQFLVEKGIIQVTESKKKGNVDMNWKVEEGQK